MDEIVAKTVKNLEQALDNEIEALDDLETIRRKRLQEMKSKAKLQQKWQVLGHGEMSELTIEKEFFETTKKSDQVLCLFYDNTAMACKIFEKHLKQLARKHTESKFVAFNLTKCSFLRTKLAIKLVPTVVLVKNNTIVGRIAGLSLFDNRTDFSGAYFEWQLAQFDIISYDGDRKNPPPLLSRQNSTYDDSDPNDSAEDDCNN